MLVDFVDVLKPRFTRTAASADIGTWVGSCERRCLEGGAKEQGEGTLFVYAFPSASGEQGRRCAVSEGLHGSQQGEGIVWGYARVTITALTSTWVAQRGPCNQLWKRHEYRGRAHTVARRGMGPSMLRFQRFITTRVRHATTLEALPSRAGRWADEEGS